MKRNIIKLIISAAMCIVVTVPFVGCSLFVDVPTTADTPAAPVATTKNDTPVATATVSTITPVATSTISTKTVATATASTSTTWIELEKLPGVTDLENENIQIEKDALDNAQTLYDKYIEDINKATTENEIDALLKNFDLDSDGVHDAAETEITTNVGKMYDIVHDYTDRYINDNWNYNDSQNNQRIEDDAYAAQDDYDNRICEIDNKLETDLQSKMTNIRQNQYDVEDKREKNVWTPVYAVRHTNAYDEITYKTVNEDCKIGATSGTNYNQKYANELYRDSGLDLMGNPISWLPEANYIDNELAPANDQPYKIEKRDVVYYSTQTGTVHHDAKDETYLYGYYDLWGGYNGDSLDTTGKTILPAVTNHDYDLTVTITSQKFSMDPFWVQSPYAYIYLPYSCYTKDLKK